MTPASANKPALPEPLRAVPPVIDDRSLFFKLIRVVNETARPFTETLARQHRLTLNEWRVMVVVTSHPGIAAFEVAAHVGLDKMSISRAIAGLAREGRVLRKADRVDARRVLLQLSKAGQRLYDEIGRQGAERAQTLFRDVSAAELAAMERTVDKMLHAIGAAEAAPSK